MKRLTWIREVTPSTMSTRVCGLDQEIGCAMTCPSRCQPLCNANCQCAVGEDWGASWHSQWDQSGQAKYWDSYAKC